MFDTETEARAKSARAIAEAAYSAGYTAGLWRAAQVAEREADDDGRVNGVGLAVMLRWEGTSHA